MNDSKRNYRKLERRMKIEKEGENDTNDTDCMW